MESEIHFEQNMKIYEKTRIKMLNFVNAAIIFKINTKFHINYKEIFITKGILSDASPLERSNLGTLSALQI